MLAAPDTFTGTQYLSRRVDPLHFCVKSLNASPQFGASSPQRRAEAPAAGVPPRGPGSRQQPPTARYPGHCAVVSPNLSSAWRPPAASVAGSGWLAPQEEKAIKSGFPSETCSSGTAQVAAPVPAPRAPAGG